MVRVKPFAAIRPPKELVTEVAAPPYDVLNSLEAKELAGEKSLLHITKPEIDFDPMPEDHDPVVYDEAVKNFKLWQTRGWLKRDPKECYYVYAQTMGERTQYGLVLCAHTDDYASGRIKKHELTRKDKEDDRMVHVRIQNANIEPVFFAYKDNAELNAIVAKASAGEPEYDFVDENGFGHRFWPIVDQAVNDRITAIFTNDVDAFYVADGHHRTAAAARVGAEKKAQNPNHTGDEEYNFFMAVCFPESQLKILDYNRVLKDLNGRTPEQLMDEMKKVFDIAELDKMQSPAKQNQVNFYMGGKWYACTFKAEYLKNLGPVDSLDVALLQKLILKPLFDIDDPRTSKRIDFVGGIRGLGELVKRVDSGECACAFAMYPTTLDQLMNIADAGEIMPPKSTWFEPKLRDGLLVHSLD